MDPQRGRSPSAGHQQSHINPNHSPSPHHFQDNTSAVGLGLGLESTDPSTNQQYQNGASFGANNTLPTFDNNDFINQQSQSFSSNTTNDPNYSQNRDFNQHFKQESQPSYNQEQPTSFTDLMGSTTLSPNFGATDFPLFTTNEQNDPQYFKNEFYPQAGNASVNPAELDMSSPPPNSASSPPAMLQPDNRTPSSTHNSPNFNQGQFQPSPGHSRHASLGPESAAYPQGHNSIDWSMMAPSFQGHRRTPSEYSDISNSSAAPSPNLGHHDSFDPIDPLNPHHSPMHNPQNDGMYQEVMGLGNFTLSDSHSPNRGLSPAHSPAISPRLGPQTLPNVNQQNQFMLGVNNGFGHQQNIYSAQNSEYPQIHHDGSLDMDQSHGMPANAPIITLDLAPPSRTNSFEPPKPGSFDNDALTPPDRGRRRRAVSDPYNTTSTQSRSHTPSIGSLSPEIGSSRGSDASRSLSPNDRTGATSPSRRRQSTSALPNRDYILGLADPEYQAQSSDSNAKRVQKHPATFQCTLCPKRFTRAYNLRSHLRTHTDERPFVCTVCGKAFARQHDRKRHEGLHSGEKKFVCKGELKQGGQWGCGRRFARADALGRHFRSEAGRICIKPLLDEEAIERQRQWHEQRSSMMQQQMAVDANGFPLVDNHYIPAALLAQYPALATMNWENMPQGDIHDDDVSGRSSFDASGSEYYEEGDDGGYISGGPGPQQNYGQPQMGEGFNGGYSSDIGGR